MMGGLTERGRLLETGGGGGADLFNAPVRAHINEVKKTISYFNTVS